jgi:hypothetical protein
MTSPPQAQRRFVGSTSVAMYSDSRNILGNPARHKSGPGTIVPLDWQRQRQERTRSTGRTSTTIAGLIADAIEIYSRPAKPDETTFFRGFDSVNCVARPCAPYEDGSPTRLRSSLWSPQPITISPPIVRTKIDSTRLRPHSPASLPDPDGRARQPLAAPVVRSD